jgi:plasmid stabilization system protein ParE
MKPVRLTPRVDSDIDACLSWIAKDNPAVALRFLDALRAYLRYPSRMPGIGRPVMRKYPLSTASGCWPSRTLKITSCSTWSTRTVLT